MQAKHIVVHGMVQGVGFRFFVQRAGSRLGLGGNVRNLPDSTVEIVVEGDARRIAEFVREVSRGPSMAHVDRMQVSDLEPTGRYHSFMIEGW
jgi:acylphosphatase